jgi:hypothetical protein
VRELGLRAAFPDERSHDAGLTAPERAAFVASPVDGDRIPPDEAERVPMPGGSLRRIAEEFSGETVEIA